MANCVICGGKPGLYIEGKPFCPKCGGSSPQEREKRSEQTVSEINGPSVRQLPLKSVDEILRIGSDRSRGRVFDIDVGFAQVRALYRRSRLNSAVTVAKVIKC